jgi:hypothetical protein
MKTRLRGKRMPLEDHPIDPDMWVYKPREYAFLMTPEQSEWQCYLFGNRPGGMGIVYRPNKGKEPNWFVRWMMKICFDCLWVKEMKK